MPYASITNLWNSVKHLLVSQYNGSNNLKKFIEIAVNGFQSVENGSDRVSRFLDVDEADGRWLDLIGELKNIKRFNGENDNDFRSRLKGEFSVDYAGTEKFVIEHVQELQGDEGDQAPVFFEDESEPAKFFVYTPDGPQLMQSQVRRLAVAGVLGMVGAALMFEDNTAVCAEGGTAASPTAGDIFLVAAEDGNA